MWQRIYLSLGSNLEDREKNLHRAMELLASFCRDMRFSRIYLTTPMYVEDQPDFLNVAAEAETELSPERLLGQIHAVEASVGRDRSHERRMGPRMVDLDILLYGRLVLESPELVLPHPRMTERAFVLVPLLELRPDLTDPRTGLPYRDALAGLPAGGVRPFERAAGG